MTTRPAVLLVLLLVAAAPAKDVIVVNGLRFKGSMIEPAKRPDPRLAETLREEGMNDGYSVYWYDLDGDGVPEAVVNYYDSRLCGSGGCSWGVYRLSRDGKYEDLGEIFGFPPVVVSARHRTRGWSDLIMYGRHTNHDDGDGYYLMKFDGTRYQSEKNEVRFPDDDVVHGVLLDPGFGIGRTPK